MVQAVGSRVILTLTAAVCSAFVLIFAWEAWGEQLAFALAGIPYDDEFESEERWYFVLVTTSVVVISLIAPAVVLSRNAKRLTRAYSELVEAQQKADTLARHDMLTGLPNRRVFSDVLSKCLAGTDGTKSYALLIDLDKFKPVNDLRGHHAGDAVLCEVAERLRSLVPKGGVVARLGGDEFGMTVPAVAVDDVIRLSQRLIDAIETPYRLGDTDVRISASIGIAACGDDGVEPSAVMRSADLALYRAKKDGRGVFRFFEEGMDRDIRERAQLENDLRRAIESGSIEPHYQPLVDLRSRDVVGFEILSRWNRPGHGMVSPEVFIAVAEDVGLIHQLTTTVLEKACLVARTWPAQLGISLNLSPSQLKDRELPRKLLSTLSKAGFPASRLEIEITESALVSDIDLARQILAELSDVGVTIALDDFGTGYSSLYHLRELGFDRIKIDRSFVQSMTSNSDSMKMVGAILSLGSSLHLPVTAEGVEKPAHAKWLARHGCNVGQGHLFGRPMSAEEVAIYLAGDIRSATG